MSKVLNIAIHLPADGSPPTPEALFDFAQSTIMAVIASLGPSIVASGGMPHLARGLFSAGLAALRATSGDAEARTTFERFMAAHEKVAAPAAGEVH